MVQLVASLAVALRPGGGHHAARGALEAGAGLVVAAAPGKRCGHTAHMIRAKMEEHL